MARKIKSKNKKIKNKIELITNNDLISAGLPLLPPKKSIVEDLPPFVNMKLYGKQQGNNQSDLFQTHEKQLLPIDFLSFDSISLNYVEEIQNNEDKDNIKISYLSNFTPSPHINSFKDINALQLLPESKWINEKIHNNDNKFVLDFSNKLLGDQYGSLLIKNIGNNVKHLLLCNNRLTDNGIQTIIKCISENNSLLLETIDLSDNIIRKKSAILLSKYIKNSNTLRKLVLKKLNLKDTNLQILCTGLFIKTNTSHLISLDLSDNEITDSSICYLSNYLHDSFLKDLNLSWNQIQNKGSISLFNALQKNKSLLRLDLSWNSIGSQVVDKNRLVAKAIKSMLIDNTTLVHLNLTNNQLNSFDSPIIIEGLNKNKTLLGLHIDTNVGIIDSYGYLNEITSSTTTTTTTINNNNDKMSDCLCWVCNKWVKQSYSFVATDEVITEYNKKIKEEEEKKIFIEENNKISNKVNEKKGKKYASSIIIPKEDEENPIPIIYLLTDYDNWKPDMMQIQLSIDEINEYKTRKIKSNDNILFLLSRNVPRGNHYYLFSLDDERLFYDPHKEFVSLEDMIKDIGKPLNNIDHFPPYVNIASSIDNKAIYIDKLLGNNDFVPHNKPRNKILEIIPHARKSLFINNNNNHNIEHQNIWFENYYQSSEMIKEMEMNAVYTSTIESSLSKYVTLISNIFEYFTSIYSTHVSLHMEVECFYVFLSKCSLMENHASSAFSQQAYLLMFKSFAINKLFGDEYILALSRAGFIDFIVSLSLKKYISQKMKDPSLALEYLINRNILQNIGEIGWINEKSFRNDFIITKDIELLFLIHIEKIAYLFKKYSKINLNDNNDEINSLKNNDDTNFDCDGGEEEEDDTYMTLNQFKNMFDQFPMKDQIEKNKIVWLCYRASKPLFLDNSDVMESYSEISFVEILEAIVRFTYYITKLEIFKEQELLNNTLTPHVPSHTIPSIKSPRRSSTNKILLSKEILLMKFFNNLKNLLNIHLN